MVKVADSVSSIYKKCFIHDSFFSKSASHIHHEVPQAAGGTDIHDNLVWLCSNCHNTLHRIEEKLRSGKVGAASDIADAYCPNQLPMRRRLWDLALFAHQHMQNKAKVPMADDARVDVTFTMSHKDHVALKRLIADLRKPDGKPMTLQYFLEKSVGSKVRSPR